MAYIGQNADGNFTTSVSKDTFSGNGSATAFTLSEGATTNTVDVFVENIRQEPTTAYSVDGTTLTFTAAPVTGTNNIYVVNRGPIQLSASHPAAQSLSAFSATITNDLTVDTNTLFVDASENKVGIGTTTVTDGGVTITPSVTRAGDWDAKLALQSTAGSDFPALLFSGSNTTQYGGIVGTTDKSGNVANNRTAQIAFLQSSATAGNITFSTNGDVGTTNVAERVRIDSAGNVLVGTTDTTPYNNTSGGGFVVAASGLTSIARETSSSAQTLLHLNTTGVDCILAEFAKDGTTVGSIGTDGGALYIGNDDAGIYFNDHGGGDLDAILPFDVGNGTLYNGHVDIGGASNRFKNMYLSGGVYVGGTGSANYLDDYEEGTWTPTIAQGWTSVSYTNSYQFGKYTKIGNMVTAWFWLQFSGTSAGNQLFVDGLPFTTPDATTVELAHRGGAVTFFTTPVNSAGAITAYTAGGNTRIQFYAYDDGGAAAVSNANASSDFLIGSVTYWVE